MGNRSSTAAPAGPPPLLAAAVMGDKTAFEREWGNASSSSSDTLSPLTKIHDSQGNNALHALFSCQTQKDNCRAILDLIHSTSSASDDALTKAYQKRNNLGCTPLWILVAYGNVDLLQHFQQLWKQDDKNESLASLVQVSNHQGDSPFLATCSQGNLEMVKFLREKVWTKEQFEQAVVQANQKGTTPLQILVGNHHISVLQYILSQQQGEQSSTLLLQQLTQPNGAGLSLFHICSERNSHEALQALLTFWMDSKTDSTAVDALDQILSLTDKNSANPLHVAVFCGNVEATELWIDVIQKTCPSETDEQRALLNKTDGESRTAYWIARLQGRDAIAQLLVERCPEFIDTSDPDGAKERQVEQAREQRQKAAAARQQQMTQMIDGNALMGRPS